MYNPENLISELGDVILNAGFGTEGLTESCKITEEVFLFHPLKEH